jgi:hypothetical protein
MNREPSPSGKSPLAFHSSSVFVSGYQPTPIKDVFGNGKNFGFFERKDVLPILLSSRTYIGCPTWFALQANSAESISARWHSGRFCIVGALKRHTIEKPRSCPFRRYSFTYTVAVSPLTSTLSF